MIDSDAEVRAFLIAQPPLAVFCGSNDRIVASDRLPTEYKPADGPALLFARRGGQTTYSSATLGWSYQFRAYGKTEDVARKLSSILHDVLNDKQSGKIKSAKLETPSQPLREPGTDWPFELSFYRILMATA